MEKSNLLLIHGAWSTKSSFNYIIKKILDDTPVGEIKCLEYDSYSERVPDISERAKTTIKKLHNRNGLDVVVVGHSLGGIIACDISHEKNVSRTITLSAPLSGVQLARLFQMYLLFRAPILKDVIPEAKYIVDLKKRRYYNAMDVLVSCIGFNPAIYEPSDGVVPISSQTNWTPESSKITYVEANHHEILQSAEAILTIEKALNNRVYENISG